MYRPVAEIVPPPAIPIADDQTSAPRLTEISRVAIVTGASSGIGRATSIALCQAGWNVVLSARREPELQETAKLCAEAAVIPSSIDVNDGSGKAVPLTLVVTGDVSKESDVKNLFSVAVSIYGRIDLLFNNAGMFGTSGPIEDLSLDSFSAVLSTNVISSFLCTKEAILQFKSQSPPGGRIINNGSLAAYVPRPHATAYTVSKHAILGLTKSTSLEGRTHRIACTQIDIGNAMTPMAAGHATSGALQPDGTTKKEASIDPKHVATSIVHIASLPLDVTVLQMNVMATGMPFVGRG